MSEYERNKGKLVPTGIDTENYTGEDFDTLYENGFVIVDGEVYEVEWEAEAETDSYEFCEVKENEDGSIDFHTMHYNGGGSFTEIVENALNKEGLMKKGNFDEALMCLLRMLKDSADKGNRDCREALREWDSIRGTDWYCKEGK